MSITTNHLKSFIVRNLYMMSRSVDYLTLSTNVLQLEDYQVSTLEAQYGMLLERLHKAMADLGPQIPERIHYTINDPILLGKIMNYEPIWISIPLNTNEPPEGYFADKTHPLVEKIECYLAGVESTDPDIYATVTIENNGRSMAYNELTHEYWLFTNPSRTISFQYNISNHSTMKGSGDLTQDGAFLALSPFGSWGILIRKEEGQNNQIDLSKLKKLELYFTARCYENKIKHNITVN
jgi:hypothetical protein